MSLDHFLKTQNEEETGNSKQLLKGFQNDFQMSAPDRRRNEEFDMRGDPRFNQTEQEVKREHYEYPMQKPQISETVQNFKSPRMQGYLGVSTSKFEVDKDEIRRRQQA